MNAYFTPSLLMSITDYFPVILFLIGTIFLAKYMKRNVKLPFFIIGLTGSSLIFISGLLKATGKLLIATVDTTIVWFSEIQFLLLGPGSLLLFIALLSIVLVNKKNSAVSLSFLAIKGTPLFYLMLTLTSVSTIGYLICGIILAKKQSNKKSIILYICYLVVVLAMSAFSNSGEYEIVNWICQTINSLGMLALVFAHYNLNKKDIEKTAI